MAWSKLYRIDPSPAETKLLCDLDDAMRDHYTNKTSGNVTTDHSRPLTELFDSLFK